MGEGPGRVREAVSIHAPTRGATLRHRRFHRLAARFQSTRPRGARRGRCSTPRPSPPCFNPRAHEGRDPPRRRGAPAIHVSIHAPTRGATHERSAMANPKEFQSTRPRGARPRHVRRLPDLAQVSIHAPTRGATMWPSAAPAAPPSFNPRAHEGRDVSEGLRVQLEALFQSTRPRGARRGGRC